jgi:hypothetical protein
VYDGGTGTYGFKVPDLGRLGGGVGGIRFCGSSRGPVEQRRRQCRGLLEELGRLALGAAVELSQCGMRRSSEVRWSRCSRRGRRRLEEAHGCSSGCHCLLRLAWWCRWSRMQSVRRRAEVEGGWRFETDRDGSTVARVRSPRPERRGRGRVGRPTDVTADLHGPAPASHLHLHLTPYCPSSPVPCIQHSTSVSAMPPIENTVGRQRARC